MSVPVTVDRLGPDEAAVAGAAIDSLLELHGYIRDAFPGVPQLQHRALLASIAAGLRADYEPATCELVPTRAIDHVREAVERLCAAAERHWMDDRIRHELRQLRAATNELPS